ncbi:alkaline phosphatase family protein [Cellulomonas sp. PhB143]|uniref:alkaline phosphatase family protein n=1 Tax=Cellulomonas sp. PhB143 TaxID=2485186 RepID=UPI000F9D383D|nr:alkaline phosphatase family protein [Cellulomonas sp. PhB143]ROS77168.1 type I phosphodiesterase/nucleotide pyrophosphatase [Cellulomonas sp. PhB143]
MSRTALPGVRDLTGALWSLVATALGLGLALWLVPGAGATGPGPVLLVALAVAVGDAVVRPPLRLAGARIGAVGAIALGILVQLAVSVGALVLLPGIDPGPPFDALAVLLVASVVMATGQWLFGSNDPEYVVSDVLRRARRTDRRARARAGAGPEDEQAARTENGLLVVQLDGVSRPTFDLAVQAGLVPTLAAWVRGGGHSVESWWARVPCTTPASQAGLLHGTSDAVPAFRWWDRVTGRLVVTNRPADAAAVEEMLSDGDGLLAHGGTAVSTMFSGDATTSLLVMSRAGGRGGLGPGRMFVHFFSSPFVLARALVGTVAETLKEVYQGWQQAVRGVRPRVGRLGWFPVLRGVSNVVLRDLNVSLVAGELLRGVPTVFVDLVDYDEIAHHAGPVRPESLRALEGLDRVVGLLSRVAEVAPRRYEIVVLSDHGQSLGEVFAEVAGRSFREEVELLMGEPDHDVHARAASDDEDWGAVNAALNALSRSPEPRMAVGPSGDHRERRHRDPRARVPAPAVVAAAARPVPPVPPPPDQGAPVARDLPMVPDAQDAQDARDLPMVPDAQDAQDAPDLPEVAVVGSGNLGLVWFPRSPVRLRGDEVRARWPRLLPGLLAHPAVGVVVCLEPPRRVETGDEGPDVVAYGRAGRRDLVTGDVEGDDPLEPYGTRAAPDLLRAARMTSTGDLIVVSSVDEAGLVHAFEGLVGSHGGLGGAQGEALLVRPTGFEVPDGLREEVDGRRMLVGAESVHERLVAWSRELGLRP